MGQPFKLEDNFVLLSTEAPGGLYNTVQLQSLAEICEEESLIVKATEDQRLAMMVPADKLEEISNKISETGLSVRHYQDGLHQPVACIGKQCPMYDQDALATALELTETLNGVELSSPLKIGINGCANCCVPTHTLDISLIGDTSGYRLSLGGKTSQIPEMATFMAEGIPADKAANLIAAVIAVYKEHVQEEESLLDVLDRVGAAPFVSALSPYSQDAAMGSAEEDPFGSLDADSVSEENEVPQAEQVEMEDSSDELINLDDLPQGDETGADHEIRAQSEEDGAGLTAECSISQDIPASAPDIDPSALHSVEAQHLKDEVHILEDEAADDVSLMNEESLLADDLLSEDLIEESDEAIEIDDEAIIAAAEEIDTLAEEPQTNASDSTPAPQPVKAAAKEQEDLQDEFDEISDADITEMNEDEERELEGKLEVSIEEQAALPEFDADENSDARDEALGLISEHSSDSFDSFEDTAELAGIPQEHSTSPALTLGEPVLDTFKSLEFVNGKIKFCFTSGATVSFAADKLSQHGGHRTFNLAGQSVAVYLGDRGVQIEVDGVEAFVPLTKDAA